MKSQPPHREENVENSRQRKNERDYKSRVSKQRLTIKTKKGKADKQKRSAIDQFLAEAYNKVNTEKSKPRIKN